MIHTDDSRPSDFTFAHTAVQTDSLEDEDSLSEGPEELRQTIGCHLWLANLVSAGKPPGMLRQPVIHILKDQLQ